MPLPLLEAIAQAHEKANTIEQANKELTALLLAIENACLRGMRRGEALLLVPPNEPHEIAQCIVGPYLVTIGGGSRRPNISFEPNATINAETPCETPLPSSPSA